MASSNPPLLGAADDRLVSILRDDLDLKFESLSPTMRLIDDLRMGSVAFAISLVAIEERFGTQLSKEDLLYCTPVGDLQSAIAARVNA
nr:acyl carrier protein [Mycobacterium lepraemurium]